MYEPICILIDADQTTGAVTAVPAWLPWGLVGSGVLILGLVIGLLLKHRKPVASDPQAARAASELADLKNQLIEVKKLAATVADDLDKRAERLERLIAQADSIAQTQEQAPTSPQRPATLPPVDDLTQRVFTLADQGRTPVQIAQALRQPVGNVELMLALRGGGGGSGGKLR